MVLYNMVERVVARVRWSWRLWKWTRVYYRKICFEGVAQRIKRDIGSMGGRMYIKEFIRNSAEGDSVWEYYREVLGQKSGYEDNMSLKRCCRSGYC